MTAILEVAIGLVLVFSAFSLICSAVGELIAEMLKLRKKELWKGIRTLIGPLEEKIAQHPLIDGKAAAPTAAGRPDVSYIPTATFVLCLLDQVGENAGAFPRDATALRAGIKTLSDARLAQALGSLLDEAGDDMERAKANIGVWFDHHMERVSGWYKRRMQLILFGVGVVAAAGLGVDSIAIASTLWRDPTVRDAMVRSAESYVKEHHNATTPDPTTGIAAAIKETEKTISALDSLGAPTITFWRHRYLYPKQDALVAFGAWLKSHLFGFVFTAFAASLGAPFWFDLLGKIVNLRSSASKPEPAPMRPSPPAQATR